MSEFVYCGRLSPLLRTSMKLKCLEPYITYEVLKEAERLHLNINSELSVDQLLSIIEKVNKVRFLFI